MMAIFFMVGRHYILVPGLELLPLPLPIGRNTKVLNLSWNIKVVKYNDFIRNFPPDSQLVLIQGSILQVANLRCPDKKNTFKIF